MTDIITPVPPTTTTQKERRCAATLGRNNLDAVLSATPTAEEIAAKYSMQLHCVDEPQDANGDQTGPREHVVFKEVPFVEMMGRNFTYAGVTLPGAVILGLYNEIVDAYKGD
jgi:hypothetical protein